MLVVGGRAVAAMRRVAENDFRSNAELGGRGEQYPLDTVSAAYCEKIAGALGLDFCGIDLLFGRDGYKVCEVNSNAFFGTFERVTGVNVARLYAAHILHTMQKNR